MLSQRGSVGASVSAAEGRSLASNNTFSALTDMAACCLSVDWRQLASCLVVAFWRAGGASRAIAATDWLACVRAIDAAYPPPSAAIKRFPMSPPFSHRPWLTCLVGDALR